MKAWRNPDKANSKVVLIARPLSVDSEGFLPELLEPEEVAKLARLNGWRYVDRDGSEVQAMRLSELSAHRDEVLARLAREKLVFEDLQRRLADIEQRIAAIQQEAQYASERAQAELQESEDIDLERLNMNELLALAGRRGIVVSKQERKRELIVKALQAVMTPRDDQSQTAVMGGEA